MKRTAYALLGAACAAALLTPWSASADDIVWDGSAGDGFWTNGPQNVNNTAFPNNPGVGANWTVNAGTPGQIIAPDIGPGGNMIDYTFNGHDWTINNATLSEDVQVKLDGGSLNITNSTVSLLPSSANTTAGLSGLNLGQGGNPTTAVFTSSTVNVSRSNQNGSALRVLNGSSLSLVDTTVNATSEFGNGTVIVENAGSSLVMDATSVINAATFRLATTGAAGSIGATVNGGTIAATADIRLNGINNTLTANNADISAATFQMTNTNSALVVTGGTFAISNTVSITNIGSTATLTNADVDVTTGFEITNPGAVITLDGGTIDTGYIRLNSGSEDVQDLMFNLISGTVTLTDANPFRDNSGFEGQFDWTGAVGAAAVTHVDLSANNTNLAAKIAQGFFSIDGTRVNPSLSHTVDWTDPANIGTLNAELAALAVNNKRLELVQDLGAGTQTLSLLSALVPGDTDGDGDIDDSDLGTAFSNYTGPLPPGTGGKTAADGDTDGDGDVDDSDLGTAFSGYTGPLGPATVPEPTSLALLGLAGLLTARRRRATR
ncbi:MAG: PEP-CTERM sorting domain-containing protein [Phycisphaeraceae bacterium]